MAYEDFTTYTEADEGNDITVDSATKVSWVDLYTRNETGYLYKDKGVSHFNSDFTHKFEIYFSKMNGLAFKAYWMLSNQVGDVGAVDVDGDAYTLLAYDSTENIYLRLFENGVPVSDLWATPGPQLDTLYFIEITRDRDGGANNTGRITAYIRTGSHSGALQDWL